MNVSHVTDVNGSTNAEPNPQLSNFTTISTTSKATMKLLLSNNISVNQTRSHRKMARVGTKRPNNTLKNVPEMGTKFARSSKDVSDNSNDSGFGFDSRESKSEYSNQNSVEENANCSSPKSKKIEVHKDTNFLHNNIIQKPMKDLKCNTLVTNTTSNIIYPILRINNTTNMVSNGRSAQKISNSTRKTSHQAVTLTSQLSSVSRSGKVQLQIVNQPEVQHRARYQTEGSRGAVKDRTGNGYPTVQLVGYNKAATLQVFIGTDMGRVAPHVFYQACRVTGKNSTACSETKINGTVIIEIKMDENDDKLIVCDCVGILKERNVDVEQRFPEHAMPRNKKKSTRCRMIFRASIINDDGSSETLQICSLPIVCTQPPGIPEISKRSLSSSECTGGAELYIIGKNFLKDSRVVFQEVIDNDKVQWEESVVPDKEYFHQTHLICVVPPYWKQNIGESVTTRFFVLSGGKASEPHTFIYTPNQSRCSDKDKVPSKTATKSFLSKMLWPSKINPEVTVDIVSPTSSSSLPVITQTSANESVTISSKTSLTSNLLNLCQNLAVVSPTLSNGINLLDKNSSNHHIDDAQVLDNTENLILMNPKAECDNNAVNLDAYVGSKCLPNDKAKNDLTTNSNADLVNGLAHSQPPSFDTLQRFVVTESSSVPLPAQSGQTVENYFSHLANSTIKRPGANVSPLTNMDVSSENDANSFLSQSVHEQPMFPIIADSQLKSATSDQISIHDEIMEATSNSILLSNILQSSAESNESCIPTSNANLLANSVTDNIMVIETQSPILSLTNHNNILTSSPILNTDHMGANCGILINTSTTESPISHETLILASNSQMGNNADNNVQHILSDLLKNSESIAESQIPRTSPQQTTVQTQFLTYTNTTNVLNLVSNDVISPSALIAVQTSDNNVTVIKKEDEQMISQTLTQMSDNDFIYISTNCFN